MMNLLNASKISITATKVNDSYQAIIIADDTVEITVTGNRAEMDSDLEKAILDNIESIHKAKKQKSSTRVKPVQSSVDKKPTVKKEEQDTVESEEEIDDVSEDNVTEETPKVAEPKKETIVKKDEPAQGSLF